MTLLAFAKAMLGDQLAKYGFEHKRNTTWVRFRMKASILPLVSKSISFMMIIV